MEPANGATLSSISEHLNEGSMIWVRDGITAPSGGGSEMKTFLKFLKSEEGVTAIEYALICGLFALAIIVGATAAGQWMNATFQYIADTLLGSGAAVPVS